jgi:acyl-CoA synthetase (AMP-forming)/AMP-acid ligase II
MTSFVDTFLGHVRDTPGKSAVIFSSGYGDSLIERPLSYSELDATARSIAGWLRERHEPGTRALLLYPNGVEFVCAFMACLYAEIVPVPAPLPGVHREQYDRTSGIAVDAEVSVVLTDSVNLAVIAAWAYSTDLSHVACIATDAIEAVGGFAVDPDASALAFLQYTSGSTSAPKGVMVSRDNLLANLRVGQELLEWTGELTYCSWLPVYHDMGLIAMVLAPLYLGGTTVLFSPTDFLKRPLTWLELIQRHGAQASGAPNFAFDLCVRRITPEQAAQLDLSHWRYACNGAEPVDPGTLTRFAERFAPAGFRSESFIPGYGLAESTVFVAGVPPTRLPSVKRVDRDLLARDEFVPVTGENPDVTLVSSGVVASDLDLRVIDPAMREPVPDGRIGEIWIRGGSVAQGYWRKPEETGRTFNAVTAGGDAGFLRTGDLGTLHAGELYLTGRIKELIILNGRNLYPYDIERAVRGTHELLTDGSCCVFSVPSTSESVVVIQEVRARQLDGTQLTGLAAQVRRSLSAHAGVPGANVVFVRARTIRRTTSGKVQRNLMRQLFMTGELDAVHEDLDDDVRRRYRRVPEGVA